MHDIAESSMYLDAQQNIEMKDDEESTLFGTAGNIDKRCLLFQGFGTLPIRVCALVPVWFRG